MKIITLYAYTLTLVFSGPVLADQYPSSDATYTRIAQDVYHGVSADNIAMDFDNSIRTREQLCDKLINKHNNAKPAGAKLNNALYIGESMDRDTCLNALWYSKGYAGPKGLRNWAGEMTGTWYADDGKTYNDPAIWDAPTKETTKDPRNDKDASGQPRVYDFQKVTFTSRSGNARNGWNQSHPEVAYIWGWDPKDNGNQNGGVGTHVGWTLKRGDADCIIWATKKEAFLECIKPYCGGKRRTSAGLFGVGQWEIGDTKNCRTLNTPTRVTPALNPRIIDSINSPRINPGSGNYTQ